MTATSQIRLALAELATLQQGLAILDPVRLERCKAFEFFPPQNQDMTDPVTWCNEVAGSRIKWVSGNDRHTFWTIRTQLFVRDASLPTAAAAALEFYEKFVAAIEANMILGGTLCKPVGIEGASPSMNPILTWNGKDFGGLNLILSMETEKAVTLAAPSS